MKTSAADEIHRGHTCRNTTIWARPPYHQHRDTYSTILQTRPRSLPRQIRMEERYPCLLAHVINILLPPRLLHYDAQFNHDRHCSRCGVHRITHSSDRTIRMALLAPRTLSCCRPHFRHCHVCHFWLRRRQIRQLDVKEVWETRT